MLFGAFLFKQKRFTLFLKTVRINIGDKVNCKRCGRDLPSVGYKCTNCGFYMDAEQVKKQKESMLLHQKSNRCEFVGEKYGGKKVLFQARESSKAKHFGIFFFMGVLLFVFLVVLLVYLSMFWGK